MKVQIILNSLKEEDPDICKKSLNVSRKITLVSLKDH